MPRYVVPLNIEIAVEIDDENLDDDEAREAAYEILDEMRLKEYLHAGDSTMVGLTNRHGFPISDKEVEWSIPDYIDTDGLRME